MDELQAEECEALEAIFECDENFTKVDDLTYQYKIKDENTENTNGNFLIQFKWGINYPDEAPDFSLDSFFNCHLTDATKVAIMEGLTAEAEENLGMSMVYTLIEFAKDNQAEWAVHQKERVVEEKSTEDVGEKKVKEKKEQLSKRQKSRLQDRFVDGEFIWLEVVQDEHIQANCPVATIGCVLSDTYHKLAPSTSRAHPSAD